MGEFFDAMLRYAPLAAVISTFIAVCAAWSSSTSAEATREAVRQGERRRLRGEIVRLSIRADLEFQRVQGRAKEVKNGWLTLSTRFGSKAWGTQNKELAQYLDDQLEKARVLVSEVTPLAEAEGLGKDLSSDELATLEIKCTQALECVLAMKEDLEREVSGIEKERVIVALETIRSIGTR